MPDGLDALGEIDRTSLDSNSYGASVQAVDKDKVFMEVWRPTLPARLKGLKSRYLVYSSKRAMAAAAELIECSLKRRRASFR